MVKIIKRLGKTTAVILPGMQARGGRYRLPTARPEEPNSLLSFRCTPSYRDILFVYEWATILPEYRHTASQNAVSGQCTITLHGHRTSTGFLQAARQHTRRSSPNRTSPLRKSVSQCASQSVPAIKEESIDNPVRHSTRDYRCSSSPKTDHCNPDQNTGKDHYQSRRDPDVRGRGDQ